MIMRIVVYPIPRLYESPAAQLYPHHLATYAGIQATKDDIDRVHIRCQIQNHHLLSDTGQPGRAYCFECNTLGTPSSLPCERLTGNHNVR